VFALACECGWLGGKHITGATRQNPTTTPSPFHSFRSLSESVVHARCLSLCRCRSPSPAYSRCQWCASSTICVILDALSTLSPALATGSDWIRAGWSARVGVVAPTAPAQRAALVELYIATNGSGWSNRAGWQDYATASDPCDNGWSGVTCSGSGGSANRGV
jgi:hypothetical protein